MYVPTQEDIKMLAQSNRDVYCYIDILNENFKKIGSLDGEVIRDSYSFVADSDIRKTMSLTVQLADSSFLIGRDKKLWFDKYLDVAMGIKDIRTGEIRRYPIGLFLFYDIGYQYDEVNRTLSIGLVDRVADLNGDRRGVLSGRGTVIPSESDIRSAMISTITELGGITKYRIDDIGKTVPYDLEFLQGVVVWDIVKKLRDLYPGWETYFDRDVFVCQEYPTTTSAPSVVDDTILRPLVQSESIQNHMNRVKNVIEVWGKCLDADHYTEDVVMSGSEIQTTYASVSELSSGTTFGFKAPASNVGACTIKINEFESYPILGENNAELTQGQIIAGKEYVVKYKVFGREGYFYFQGEYQVAAIAKLVASEPTNEEKADDLMTEPTDNIFYIVEPDSPYAIEVIGEMRDSKYGGEYDNILSEDLAAQRAKYDLWLATDMLDNITLDCIEIPWLEVNQKIQYTPFATGVTAEYIVTSKSGSTTGGTMTINCTKFQPLYSWAE